MMQVKQAFICGLLVATSVCLGGRELAGQIRTVANSRFYTMPDGTMVQNIRPEPNETAESLNIKRWQIRATLPPGSDADSFEYDVEVYKGGLPLHPFGGSLCVLDRNRTMDLTLVLRPEVPDWNKASFVSVWSSDNFPARYEGQLSQGYALSNPFNEARFKGWDTSNDLGPQTKDGAFVLMSAHEPLTEGPVDEEAERKKTVSIVFKLKAVNQRKEFPSRTALQSPRKPLSPSWQAWFH